MNFGEIATLVFAFCSFLGAIYAIREVKWKNKEREANVATQYEKLLSQTIKKYEGERILTEQYREKIDQLEEEIEELRTIIEEWDKGIEALVKQLETNELIPAWQPKKHYQRKSIDV